MSTFARVVGGSICGLLIMTFTINYTQKPEILEPAATTNMPHLVHGIWMANPLKPFAMACIDSVARHMPGATYRLHVVTPVHSNSTILKAIRSRFERQLDAFIRDPRIDLQIVLHSDVPSELVGTPLENVGITQEHLGGAVEKLLMPDGGGDRGGSPHGANKFAMCHASDLMRYLVLYREGGLYMDMDHLVLRDAFPLIEVMGAFAVCQNVLDVGPQDRCALVGSFMASPPGHPFFEAALRLVAKKIALYGVNGIFPSAPKWTTAGWGVVGPDLMDELKNRWVKKKRDVWMVPGNIATELNSVQSKRARPAEGMPEETSLTTSFSVTGRRYFMPTTWKEHTMHKSMTQEEATRYDSAFCVHLWEMASATGQRQIRHNFVSVATESPDSVLAELHRRSCLLYCDPSRLQIDVPPLGA